MDVRIQTGWDNDPAGRIRNLSLAPNAKNSLFPLFEAVMNSIHAVEDRFGKDNLSKGEVTIELHRTESGEMEGFTISDNGIGFNESNLESFRRMDSRAKEKIGGKGVGRLVWLKVLDEVRIQSVYDDGSIGRSISFDFKVSNPTDNLTLAPADQSTPGSIIQLTPYKRDYALHIPKKASTITNRLLAHFISYFINISHPKITVCDVDAEIDLFEAFSESVERDADYRFTLSASGGSEDFVCHCFLLPKAISDDERSTNALYLGANGRAVKRFDMDGVIGLKAIDNKFAFLGYIESAALDESVNDTRTDFSLSEDEIESIVDQAKERVKEFLAPELAEIREKQTGIVSALRIEHPRFLSIQGTDAEVAETLHYGTNRKEDIFVEMSRQSLRQYERRKNAFKRSIEKKLPDVEAKAKEYVAELKQESVSSLAEYVMKRKLVLDVFEESLKFKPNTDQDSEYEDVLHDIICPLKSTSSDLDYDDHNLWIVDDRLAFYSYFNSDTRMEKQVSDPTHPKDRPDVSIFDLGLGFENEDKSSPITIVEFKRPKIDNYTLEKNPITQVRKYVEDMRKSGEAIKYDGTPIRSIEETTPFMCHIIADITPKLRDVMKALGNFHRKAGSNTYYSWDASYSIFIEVSSFKDVLESAKSRNRAFFERIGISV
jgi:hypothetical protein